jgi:adenine/guanine phosphoribosyltransferase-like PRPP-binding protein
MSTTPFPILNGLTRTEGVLRHNLPNRDGFAVSSALSGSRVLIIDDVYTSGARAQSAAFALRSAGVTVAALCVLGRRYNAGYNEDSRVVLADQESRPFSWSVGDREITQTSTV